MASNINPANINGQYPIAGQDNDSQGFRDNFTNTRNNLTFAKTEIEDLQSKVVLKAALSGGGALSNDLTNVLLSNARTTGFIESFATVASASNLATIVFTGGDLQKITTTEFFTLAFTGWPTSGFYGKVRVWINVTSIAHHITFPTEVTIGLSNFVGVTSRVLTPVLGDYLLEFSTVDGGTTVTVELLVGPAGATDNDAGLLSNVSILQGNVTTLEGNVATLTTLANVTLPTLSSDPGVPGQVIADASWIYVCVADGVWVRSAATAW